ncbi:histidine kinase [Anabaena sp. UHCC 0204]|uniref:histidine kinase n=1 Tax=Anabaena sp. UHCC 0204 TaxID=2590009 RepID=UPI001446DE7F|nr:histidine kinase [Anabaena sp. UHCC 0204]MTJ06215.1 histidine kinase [Anabaena sp. UHCC 0204]
MNKNVKEQIQVDLRQAKETGQLKAERIREIVKSAVSQVGSEFQEGSHELRNLVNDAVSTVIENLQDKGSEVKEGVVASIEGAMEAINIKRHSDIVKTQGEIKQLQARLDREEDELQSEVEGILTKIVETSQDKSADTKIAINSAIDAIKDSDEVGLLKKRYAQLQAQLAIVRANLSARYSGSDQEVQDYLNEAKQWYDKSHTQAESVSLQVKEKYSLLEQKMLDAGASIAKKERQLKQTLRELLLATADLFKDKEVADKDIHS